ncbi:MAG: MoxR family ATPase [Nannocystis sp.]|nr:MoxR family ATPase [Nannocystis sp.]
MNAADTKAQLVDLQQRLDGLTSAIRGVIVGQEEIIRSVLICLLAGGHGLLEGVPGLGKTLLIRTLAGALDLSFARVQFTPDLMPADILGTSVLVDAPGGARQLQYQQGPIFSHIVLADEINRATPKTQSALLEAMAEGQVTAAGHTRPLPSPFLVLATQNPLEMEGTYPLPEAQLDRFLFKIHVPFPDEDELVQILDRTTGSAESAVRPVLDGPRLLQMKALVRALPVAPTLTRYVARLLRATHPTDPHAPELVRRYVRFGASPRGAQAMLLAARVLSVLQGRLAPSAGDVRAVLLPALRHRVLLNFEGEAEGIRVDTVLDQVLAAIPQG